MLQFFGCLIYLFQNMGCVVSNGEVIGQTNNSLPYKNRESLYFSQEDPLKSKFITNPEQAKSKNSQLKASKGPTPKVRSVNQKVHETLDELGALKTQPILSTLLGSRNKRQSQTQNLDYPFNCIGALYFLSKTEENGDQIQVQRVGTGFLIMPNVVVTSSSFIDDYQRQENGSMKFLITSYSKETSNQTYTQVTNVIGYSIREDYDRLSSGLNEGFGLVYLNTNVLRKRYIKLATNFNQINAEIEVFGVSQQHSTNKMLQICRKGQIKQYNNNVVHYDVESDPWQIGSPILLEYIAKEYVAVGIHCGKREGQQVASGSLLNFQSIEILRSWIQQFLNQQIIQKSELHQSQFVHGIESFESLDFKSSSLMIINEIGVLKIERQEENAENLKDQNQLALEKAEKCYLEQKFHQSLVIAQKFIKQGSIQQHQKFQFFNLIGLNYYRLSQFELALFFYSESLKIQLELNRPNKLIFVRTLNYIGTAFLYINQTDKAMNFINQAKKQSKGIVFQTKQEQLSMLMNQASLCIVQSNILKAYNLLKSAKVLSFQISNYYSQQKASILNQLANTCFALQKYDEWLQYSFGSLMILKELKLEEHQQSLNWYQCFVRQINSSMEKAEKALLFKLGRIWHILQKNNLDISTKIIKRRQFLLNGTEKIKAIQ